MFPVGSRSRNRGRGFAFNRGAKVPPTFAFDFLRGSLDSRITFTRASAGTNFNSAGALVTAATDAPRFDYNPSTLIARGLLIEEARTNSIRNNTMVGAVVGAIGGAGSAPTNWSIPAAAGNLTTSEITAVGTENGISYIDWHAVTNGAGNQVVVFESTTQIVAADTQTWTGSQYNKLSAGSLSNVTISNRVQYRTVAGANVATSDTAFVPTSAGLATQRNITTFTASGGTIERVTSGLLLTITGVADFTLRIGMPQLELGAFATSVISTSTVAVTRAADIASITGANFTSFWNATQGTIVARGESFSTGTTPAIVSADDGTANNRITLRREATPRGQYVVVTGGVTQVAIDSASSSWPVSTVKSVAGAYALNDFAFAQSGTLIGTDTGGTLPTVTQIQIGIGAGSAAWNGWISSLSYYPVAMPTLLRGLSA